MASPQEDSQPADSRPGRGALSHAAQPVWTEAAVPDAGSRAAPLVVSPACLEPVVLDAGSRAVSPVVRLVWTEAVVLNAESHEGSPVLMEAALRLAFGPQAMESQARPEFAVAQRCLRADSIAPQAQARSRSEFEPALAEPVAAAGEAGFDGSAVPDWYPVAGRR